MCGTECNPKVHHFKHVCDVLGFFADICEVGPLLCGVGSYMFVWVGGLCGFIGKELLCRILCIVFSSCRYSLCCRL